MRVGLNATCLTDRPSGARQRFIGIYGALARQRPDIEFIVYEPRGCAIADALGSPTNVIARRTPLRRGGSLSRLISGFGYWSRELRADRLQLFECFNMPMVRAPTCPTLLTIHDARHIHDEVAWPRRPLNRAIWRRALSQAAHVVTVSETMRREILAFKPGVEVTTVYNGIDPTPFERTTSVEASEPYMLAVGHLEPRKNYEALIDALAIMRQRGRSISLAIVGRDGGSLNDIKARITTKGLDHLVRINCDIDDPTLVSMYRKSKMVVFPSRYEGFGIPLIEAMAAQRPVVLSDIPVFRELTQDCAIYFNPNDPRAIADTLLRVYDNPRLAANLVDYGRARVRDFAFDALAKQVSELYDRLRVA